MTLQPLSHRPLNQTQLLILHHIYRFRFVATSHLAQYPVPTTKTKINRRLKLLLDQRYIGRNYEPSYHLSGRHATYYLEVKGLKTLKSLPDSPYSASVLRNMAKDKTASDRFINHWLEIFEINCLLKARYRDNIRVFTKSQLVPYNYFPRPAPDAYIRFTVDGTERQYILELIDGTQPIFAQLARIKKYLDYSEEGDWEDATGTKLPLVILVCESVAQQRRLLKLADNELDDLDDDITIIITTKLNITSVIDAAKPVQ